MARKAVERGINNTAYWLEQQHKQVEGVNEVSSHSKYTELSNSRVNQSDGIESQFVNLAFEIDEGNDTTKTTSMRQLESDFLKKHYGD